MPPPGSFQRRGSVLDGSLLAWEAGDGRILHRVKASSWGNSRVGVVIYDYVQDGACCRVPGVLSCVGNWQLGPWPGRSVSPKVQSHEAQGKYGRPFFKAQPLQYEQTVRIRIYLGVEC